MGVAGCVCGDGTLDSSCTCGDGVPLREESTELLVWSVTPLGPCGSTSLVTSRKPPADTTLDAKGSYFLSLSSPDFPAFMASILSSSSSTLCVCVCVCVCVW